VISSWLNALPSAGAFPAATSPCPPVRAELSPGSNCGACTEHCVRDRADRLTFSALPATAFVVRLRRLIRGEPPLGSAAAAGALKTKPSRASW